jgi:hypothetical protein
VAKDQRVDQSLGICANRRVDGDDVGFVARQKMADRS